VSADSRPKTVLVTGASTGIGAACAIHLDKLGFTVFANVRKESDADSLREKSAQRIQPVVFDLTDIAAVRRGAEHIGAIVGTSGLAGLVNNAGVVVAGPLEFLALDDLRRQFEINVIGHIAVTQSFLPMLRAGRGRVVNMGSITGLVATPFIGAYSASKFAMEALTDALRMELLPWGIEVVIIEPGAIATPIWEKSSSATRTQVAAMPPGALQFYGKTIEAMGRTTAKISARAVPPERVAEAVAHALTATRPKTRYLVGPDARAQALLRKLTPDRLMDWLVARAIGVPH